MCLLMENSALARIVGTRLEWFYRHAVALGWMACHQSLQKPVPFQTDYRARTSLI